MNILFLSTEIPYPPDCGHHLRTYNIIRILAEKHQLFMITFSQNPSERQYIPEMKKYCRLIRVFPIAKTGLNLKFLTLAICNLFSPTPLVAKRYFIDEAVGAIQEIIKKYNIHLVHIDMLALGLYRSEIEGIPVLQTDHNVEFLRIYRWMKVEKNILIRMYLHHQYAKLKRFERKTCSEANHCIVVSHHDLVVLGNLYDQDRYSVIPNGVDIDYFYPMETKSIPAKLVWVGSMRGAYNADAVDFFLSKIWPIIKKARPDATVDFVGDAPTAHLVSAAAEDTRLQVIGYVPDIRDYVQRAAVFIAPIRSGSGTKIKVLNAMAQAKAVVASPIAVEGIEVEEGKNVFISDDPQMFAQRIIDLLTSPQIAWQIGENARKLIEEKYSWNVIARDMHKIYDGYARLLQAPNRVVAS